MRKAAGLSYMICIIMFLQICSIAHSQEDPSSEVVYDQSESMIAVGDLTLVNRESLIAGETGIWLGEVAGPTQTFEMSGGRSLFRFRSAGDGSR